MWKVEPIIIFVFLFAGCRPPPAAAPPPPPAPPLTIASLSASPSTVVRARGPADAPPPPAAAFFEPPQVPALTPAGENLIIEFEVGGRSGYNPHPELPDLRLSGVTIGVGYDLHQNTREHILSDFSLLGAPAPARLAATQPFYGRSAVEPWRTVRDIIVPWQIAIGVFDKIDVAREWARAERALAGFDALRPNAQAALISLGFNRGWSMAGDSRREMRAIREAVKTANYEVIASNLQRMERVWRGTSIYHGMARRRAAEAKLVLTP